MYSFVVHIHIYYTTLKLKSPSFPVLLHRDFLFTLDNWNVMATTAMSLVVALLYYLTKLHINMRDIRRLEQRLLKIATLKVIRKKVEKEQKLEETDETKEKNSSTKDNVGSEN